MIKLIKDKVFQHGRRAKSKYLKISFEVSCSATIKILKIAALAGLGEVSLQFFACVSKCLNICFPSKLEQSWKNDTDKECT